LIDALGSPAPAVVLDPANLFEVAEDRGDIIARAVDLLADRIVMAHAKDRDARGGFVAAGTGVVDFPAFVARLKASGFDGDLVTHGLTADEAPSVARYLRGLA
jgi:sugar phosphate isomerase/epimerase